MNKSYFLLLYVFGLMCCSNGSEPEASDIKITVFPADLSFASTLESKQIEVNASADFDATSSEDWCKCTPMGGTAGKKALTVTVLRNSLETDRAAVLTFKSGTYKKEVYVRQEKRSSIALPAGYTLVWQDEFNDSRLSGGKPALPNTSDWWYETGNGGWGNNEIQNYVAGVQGTDTCAVVSNGTLKIIAKKKNNEIISIRMNTSKSWTYGYFEARLKLPQGKGTWPAFWMMPKNFVSWPDDGEIDIMEEVGYRPNYVSSSIHCKSYYHSIGTQKTAEKYVATAESDFHVYAVEWTEDHIWGFIDGESYFKFPNDKAGNKDTWPFNTPFYLKLNLAWGGNWGGAQGVDESKLPATYEIDYVRVFQK